MICRVETWWISIDPLNYQRVYIHWMEWGWDGAGMRMGIIYMGYTRVILLIYFHLFPLYIDGYNSLWTPCNTCSFTNILERWFCGWNHSMTHWLDASLAKCVGWAFRKIAVPQNHDFPSRMVSHQEWLMHRRILCSLEHQKQGLKDLSSACNSEGALRRMLEGNSQDWFG